VTAYGS